MQHNHKEAFCLMWYGCDECGHRERMWNSRDGVTPFCLNCPSCGQPELKHILWNLDQYFPGHTPHRGQRVWVDMTRERAAMYVELRSDIHVLFGFPISQIRFNEAVERVFYDGHQPDLIVWGIEK